jgi:hypothetical protein
MSLLLLFNSPPYDVVLLDTARRLLNENQPAIALVVAHMACETYAEQVMSAAFMKRNVSELEDAVTAFLPSNSLANDRVRDLYVVLTNDRIQDAAFWSRFKESSRLRNRAVHHGERISPEQGRNACEVASDFLAHLKSIMTSLM